MGADIFDKLTGRIANSDFSAWGIAALVCGAIAVFSANIAAFIPENLLLGLHSTRLQNGNVNQIGSQVGRLQSETRDMGRDYRALLSRFDMLDDDSGETVRRLAAVERSLPLLIESLPLDSDIDRSLLTASIASTSGEVYEDNGTTIVIRHSPLFGDTEDGDGSAAPSQPLPPPLDENIPEAQTEVSADPLELQGILIGDAVARTLAGQTWDGIVAEVGTLLLGTVPLLGEMGTDGQVRLVAGPLPNQASAEDLCKQLDRADIACEPAPYKGKRRDQW